MKQYLCEMAFYITPFIASYCVIYMIGSGISASFNLAEWQIQLRVFMACAGWVYGFALLWRLRYAKVHEWRRS